MDLPSEGSTHHPPLIPSHSHQLNTHTHQFSWFHIYSASNAWTSDGGKSASHTHTDLVESVSSPQTELGSVTFCLERRQQRRRQPKKTKNEKQNENINENDLKAARFALPLSYPIVSSRSEEHTRHCVRRF